MQTSNQRDYISHLPVDTNPPSDREQVIVDTLFTQHKSTMNSLYNESKDSIVVGILFILFSLPQVNDIIYKIVPSAQTSLYVTVAIKALSMMILYWVIRHFYLSRK